MSDETSVAAGNLRGHSILSFSLETWGHVWRNRHQIMSRLARDNRVLFASPPRTVRDLFQPYGPLPSESPGVTPIADGLHAYVPPRWLPINYRFPGVEQRMEGWRRAHIRHTLRRLGMKRPIVYIWHPALADQAGHFDDALLVYHCYDEVLSFEKDPAARERLAARERQLLQRADIVFASSEELARRRRQVNPNTHCVENGVDYARFSRAQDAATVVPPELARIPGPVIGCVATLLDIVDVPMLAQAMAQRPQWSLVIVGIERPATAGADAALARLLGLPNVHFIGPQPIDAIPAYLKGFDVCAIPYIVNDATGVASSPLKLFEYLAAGKPVVCYPLPLKDELAGVVHIARESDEWVRAVEAALGESRSGQGVQRAQAIARDNTWDARVQVIATRLAEQLRQPRRA